MMFQWDLLVPLAGMVTGLILLLPVVRGGVRYLERRGSESRRDAQLEVVREQLKLLHERLDSLERDGRRMMELEERVDFAERLLAQQRDARLGGGV